MATHSSTLAWKIPWTEEPGGLQSMGSLRVGHDWTTSLSLFIFMHWRRKWQPIQCSCLENPMDGGAWWAAVYGVAQSWTQLKWLSSGSSSGSDSKNLPIMQETQVQSLGLKDPWERGMATPFQYYFYVLFLFFIYWLQSGGCWEELTLGVSAAI